MGVTLPAQGPVLLCVMFWVTWFSKSRELRSIKPVDGLMDICCGGTPGTRVNSPVTSGPAAVGSPGTADPLVLAVFHLEQALLSGHPLSLELWGR